MLVCKCMSSYCTVCVHCAICNVHLPIIFGTDNCMSSKFILFITITINNNDGALTALLINSLCMGNQSLPSFGRFNGIEPHPTTTAVMRL